LFVHPNSLHLLDRKPHRVSYNYFSAEFLSTDGADGPDAAVRSSVVARGTVLARVGGVERLLAEVIGLVQPAGVAFPDLRQLQQGDADAWDEAFRWLWPTAFEAVRLKLAPFVPADVEDVAMEALEELVEKVPVMERIEELKPLVASIAHHRAVSRLREYFAAKRGSGQTTSLEAMVKGDGKAFDPPGADSAVTELDQTELATLLCELQSGLKPEQKAILNGVFVQRRSYEQIAREQGIAVGSVGVYLKRSLEVMQRLGARQPKLLKELEAFLR
jgi:RNA polymerase sigma factor (sigma-70 family)